MQWISPFTVTYPNSVELEQIFIFIVVFKNELFWCCCKTINFNFLYVALKHSPSKRKSLSRVAQRSTEADSDSHRKYYFPNNFSLNDLTRLLIYYLVVYVFWLSCVVLIVIRFELMNVKWLWFLYERDLKYDEVLVF